MRWVMILIISIYRRFVRPYRPTCCMMEPHCSEYVRQVAIQYGFIASLKALFRRYCLCNDKILLDGHGEELVILGRHGLRASITEFNECAQKEIEAFAMLQTKV